MCAPNYPIRNQDLLYEFTMKYTSKSCNLKMAGLKLTRPQSLALDDGNGVGSWATGKSCIQDGVNT
jgi:hypothetical protein